MARAPPLRRPQRAASWLYRIVTNTCLDLIRKRPKKVLPIDHGPPSDAHDGPGMPLTESIWIEPYPDEQLGLMDGRAAPEARYEQRESVELAFVAALQHLPARQRAVLILREVLGYSANEVASTLETTHPRGQLRSAAGAQDDRRDAARAQPAGDAAHARRRQGARDRRGLHGGVGGGDVEAVTAMLAEDAAITMPPMASWFRGEGVEIFLREWAFCGRVYDALGRRNVRVLRSQANGQPAIGTYSWSDEAGAHLPTVLQVLSFEGDRITEITGFVDPSVFRASGCPSACERARGHRLVRAALRRRPRPARRPCRGTAAARTRSWSSGCASARATGTAGARS